MNVIIIDYDAGNVRSLQFALNKLGVNSILSNDPEKISSADKVIFPGQGQASSAMIKLKKKGLDKVIPNLKQPLLGICLGMQIATIEFARNVCSLAGANSTEFNKETEHPVISLQEEQQGIVDMGASMRLGSCASNIYPGTKSYDFYGQTDTIHERHRHRWGDGLSEHHRS